MSDTDQGSQPTTPVVPEPTAPASSSAPETDWKAEADKWKALSRQHEQRSKDNFSEVQQLRQNQDAQQEILKALAEKAGIQLESESPDQLKAKLSEVQGQLRQRDVETAVSRKASEYGLDSEAMLDSRSFATSLSQLDPNDSDFAAKVDELVRGAATEGRYKAKKKPPVQQPSGDFTGAPDTSGQQWTREMAVHAAKNDPEGLRRAIDAGLLKNLGYGPRKEHNMSARERALRAKGIVQK